MPRVLAQPALTVIAGPTGAGKTELAVELAERLGAEIVSADSQAVYRHFDLGTAKPDAAAARRVPHHLVSVVEPTEAVLRRPLGLARRRGHRRDRGPRPARPGGGRDRAVRPGAPARTHRHSRRTRRSAGPGGRGAAARPRGHAPAARRGGSRRRPEARRGRRPPGRPGPGDPRHHRHPTLRAARRSCVRAARYPSRIHFLDPPREELEQRLAARTRRMFERGLVRETAAPGGSADSGTPPRCAAWVTGRRWQWWTAS